jgi:hypothetical protein
MAVIKIKAIATIVTKQVSKAIATIAIVMQVEEVAALIAVVVLQAAPVPQEFHKSILLSSIFFSSKFY